MNGSEAKAVANIAEAVRTILSSLGESPRSGLEDTPARVAKSFLEMTAGLRESPPEITVFDAEHDDLIAVCGLDFWSMCEHHLVPFYGKAHVGYVPSDKIAGLSKFGRVVEHFAKRPQIQEQMTGQVATYLFEKLKPKGVIVVVEATHLCMAMRGIKKENHRTWTSAIRGDIPKSEFFDLLKVSRRE